MTFFKSHIRRRNGHAMPGRTADAAGNAGCPHRRHWAKRKLCRVCPAVSRTRHKAPERSQPAATTRLSLKVTGPGKGNWPISFSSLKKTGLSFPNRNPGKSLCTITNYTVSCGKPQKELPPQPHRQRGSFLFRYRLSEQLSGGGLVSNVGSLAKRQHRQKDHR